MKLTLTRWQIVAMEQATTPLRDDLIFDVSQTETGVVIVDWQDSAFHFEIKPAGSWKAIWTGL